MKLAQKMEICRLAYQVFCEEKKIIPEYDDWSGAKGEWELMCTMAKLFSKLKDIDISAGKEEIRMRQILEAVYENIRNTGLSIRYQFSAWLRKVRIELAKCILAYMPEIKVANLAEITGFSPDGQYFSKVFRKETEMTPSEYG